MLIEAYGKEKDRTVSSATDLSPLRLLVVDENTQVREACCKVAEDLGFAVTEAETILIAQEILKRKETSIVLLDVTRPENGSLQFLKLMRMLHPETPVIAISASATISSAVATMRVGACDYLSKPFPLHVLTQALERATKRWHFDVERRSLQTKLQLGMEMVDALGQSAEMEKLYRILSNVADSAHPAMIIGESGTGKALVARSIHSNGPNSSRPYISLDCKVLGPTLLERMLFGHVKGATNEKDTEEGGLMSSPDGGTIFLDEIGDLPLELQGRLTSALAEKKVRPIGGTRATTLSVRILAATTRDLTQLVKEGRFRMDLYRLLSVVNLRIPPLRGRPDDIAFLAKRFLEKIQDRTGLTRTLSNETLRMLETYDWPDNVSELEDAISQACLHGCGPKLEAIHLPQKVLNFHRKRQVEQKDHLPSENNAEVNSAKNNIIPIIKLEKQAIREALRQTNGDKLMAAKLLGIGKTTLYRKLKDYGNSVGLDDEMRVAGNEGPLLSSRCPS
jgi:DNA-binding NtrC family response regulator